MPNKNSPQIKRTQLKLESAELTQEKENKLELLVEEEEPLVPSLMFVKKSYTKHDINICDNCEEYSDDLVEKNGQWLCEYCRELEE